MREIKFRAFNVCLEKMYDWEEVKKTKYFWTKNSSIFEKMQYTGLKDKNGVEIYEGDIIKYHFNSDHQFNLSKVAYGYASDEGGELRESVGFFRVGLNAESYRYKDMEIEVYDCPTSLTYGKRRYEVIGNIYEHKHLIGEG